MSEEERELLEKLGEQMGSWITNVLPLAQKALVIKDSQLDAFGDGIARSCREGNVAMLQIAWILIGHSRNSIELTLENMGAKLPTRRAFTKTPEQPQ